MNKLCSTGFPIMWLLKLWKIIVFVFDSIFLRSAGQCSVKLSPGSGLDLGGGRSHASWKLLLSFFVRRRLQILDGNLHVQLQEDFYNSSTPHCFSVKYLTTKQTSKLPVRLFHCLNVENKGLMMT